MTPPGPATAARPRVAFVIHDLDRNLGQGRYALELLARLHPRYEFHVFANRFAEPPPGDARPHRVAAWRRNAVTTIWSFIGPAERAVRAGRFDLVHSQGLTCWGCDLITGHMCNAAKYARLRPPRLRQRLFPRLVIPLERAFFRQRRARHLIAISAVFAREIREWYGWNRGLTVIHHGTDVARFRPPAGAEEKAACRRVFGLEAGRWNWLFMGEALKGLREAVAQLPHFPPAHLLVVSRSDLTPYREQAARLGVAGRITFFGPHDRPEEAFRAADVFVYPSGHDPFGLVVTEAMATGLPVVAGRDTGAAELIVEGRNGLLCQPEDAAGLRASLERLAASLAEAARLGDAARTTLEAHTWDHCAAATAAVYDQVLRDLQRTP